MSLFTNDELGARKQVQVVSAVILESGRFLLGKRSPHKKSAAGYWCPVSGGIEAGETEEGAIVREVSEEVGLVVEPVRKLCEMDTRDGKGRIHWWLVRIVSGAASLRNDEHTEIRWFTLDEIKALHPVFEEDIPVFEAVLATR